MNEVSDYIDSNFFIIDSDNLEKVNSELYGYSIYNNNVIYNENLTDEMELNGDGSYIRILRNNNKIQISQDYNGSYGLYVYSFKEKFIISNSFLKLIEYIKDKFPISINYDVALSFIPAELCAIEYRQTMINEIESIPTNFILNINISTKTLSYEKINYNENTISIDSLEGIELLDYWFYKWIGIIRNLKKTTNNIQVDLTGGFDSRIIFTLFLNSNINMNRISVYSINTEIHEEDYEISSMIADKFNFKLNKRLKKEFIYINPEDSMDLMNNIKLGYHKQYHFPIQISKNPVYLFGGLGGESLREYWNITPKEHTEKYMDYAGKVAKEFIEPTKKVLDKSFKLLQSDFNLENETSKQLTELLYKEVRSKNHFGKNSIMYYLTNQIRLSPLLDSNLYKLKKEENDENLLFALIFIRYCPDLLDVKFDKGKKFNAETIKHAQKINEKFPLKLKKFTYLDEAINDNKLNQLNIKNNNSKTNPPDDFIKKVFLSHSFKKLFEMYFSSNLYNKIVWYMENKTFQPLYYVHGVLAFFKVINVVKYNNEKFGDNITWLNSFLEIENFNDNVIEEDILKEMTKYDIARFDIKNYGKNSNDIEIINNSDQFSRIIKPNWFIDNEGTGYVIESHANKINITFRCINDGELKIAIRSKDIRDKNRKNFPVYIDYTKFIVNDENILKSNILTHCNKPYIFKRKVKNNEIIDLKIEWLPFNSESIYEN